LIVLAALLLAAARPLAGLLWLNYGALTLHKAVISEGNAADIAAAEGALTRSMIIAPSRAALRNLAFAAYARGDYPATVRKTEQAGGEPLMAWLAGQAYDALGEEAKALDAWSYANAAPYLTAQAFGALKQRDLEAAERSFRRSLTLEPGSATALAGLGETLYAGKRTDEAMGAFRAALVIDPDMHRAHYIMGNIYRQRGDSDAALEHLLLAAEIAPTITPYADMLMTIYGERGDLAAVERWRAFSTDYQRGN